MIPTLVTPYYSPSVHGTAITVQRIGSGLRDQGLKGQVFALDKKGGSA